MVEQINFDKDYLLKLKDLIVLSTTTTNNNIRQKYFYELLDIGNFFIKNQRN